MGFTLLADLNKGSTAIGFDRPMFVFQRPEGMRSKRKGVPHGVPGQAGTDVGAATVHDAASLHQIAGVEMAAERLPATSGGGAEGHEAGGEGRQKGNRRMRRRQHVAEDLLMGGAKAVQGEGVRLAPGENEL